MRFAIVALELVKLVIVPLVVVEFPTTRLVMLANEATSKEVTEFVVVLLVELELIAVRLFTNAFVVVEFPTIRSVI